MHMARLNVGEPIDLRLPWIRKLHDLDDARVTGTTAGRQRMLKQAGRQLGDRLREGPRVLSVRTLPTTDAPYPIRFAFNGTVWGPSTGALLIMKNRSLFVQVRTSDGIKNILFNPTDGPTNQATPFYQRIAAATPGMLRRALEPRANRCAEQLAALGLSCADIDVIAFDHFHTQDLRPLLGAGSLQARFPNALLLAPRAEWESWDDLPMLQRAWFVVDGKRDVPRQRVVLTDSDLFLGEGLIVLRTPGHTVGNQTLFAHAEHGVFGCSENGTCADNWAPRKSRIASVRQAATMLDLDVIPNSNTPELAAEQYTSMLLESALVDCVPENPEMLQMFPSSEVTRSWIAPHVKPTFTFGAIHHGDVVTTRSGSAAAGLAV
jgi:hypothetical protein